MFWMGNKINKNYAWELSGFHMIRQFSDGMSFFEFTTNWDKYLSDHTPRFDIMFIILNFKVLEFSIYYLHHRDEPIPDNHICKINLTNPTSSTLPNTTSPQDSQTSETQ